MHLYVYYDAAPGAAEILRATVAAVQAELALPRAHLLRRAERMSANDTWMEVYEQVPAGFESRLDEAVARHALAALTGPRHVERFVDDLSVDDPPCA